MGIIKIDTENAEVSIADQNGERSYPFQSPEAFQIVSDAWLRIGWDTKHVYSFTWMGRPIIQLPEDMFRIQELIYRVRPDVILECGIAHGGSLIFYASLCHAMSHGRVVGIDVEIRPHNRTAIDAHELTSEYITTIEGSSIDPDTVAKAKSLIKPEEKVLVVLDSNHSREHVLAELEAYHDVVSVDSYIVACDGIVQNLAGAPRIDADHAVNNSAQAAREWVSRHPDFVMETPSFAFNEGMVAEPVTYWPDAWLKRIKK